MNKKNSLSKIDHFVVLMLENRSFDHMLGYLYSNNKNKSPKGHDFDGLTGDEYCPNSQGKNIAPYPIKNTDPNCYFMPKADPGEGYFNTNSQLYGKHIVDNNPGTPTNKGFVTNYSYTLGWEGREHWSILPQTKPEDIMGMFTPEMLPVLSGLAKSYAVCDRWFGSVPTETLPNRAFALMATSQGRLTDKDKVYTAPSIFTSLEKANCTWAVYGDDKQPLTRHSVADITHADDSHFGEFKDFQQAAASNKLANFVFLEPSWGTQGNSQHPNYDVAKGEQLILDVYNTLKNSPCWEKTMLIITYDEHGGCYDHVPPPQNAVCPDNSAGEHDFDFQRFGPRVPAVIVSPYIEAGTVMRMADPKGTPFDHTSVLSTLQKRFGMQPLTARDAQAPHMGDVLSLDAPRKDAPMAGVKAPQNGSDYKHDDTPTHLQECMAEMVSRYPVSDEEGNGWHHKMPHFKTGTEMMHYVKHRSHQYFSSHKRMHHTDHKRHEHHVGHEAHHENMSHRKHNKE